MNFAVFGFFASSSMTCFAVFHSAGVNLFAEHDLGIGIVQAFVELELRILARFFDRSSR